MKGCGKKIGTYSCCTVIQGDCLELMKRLPSKKLDALVTDPPYGVNLVARVVKSSRRNNGRTEASTKYRDDLSFIRSSIIPRVIAALDHCEVGMVTSGVRNLFAYPEPVEVGCVFFPNGAGVSRWGFGTLHPVLYYGKDPFLARGLGSRPNGIASTGFPSEKGIDHPCPKPLKWMEWMVGRCSFEGQIVFDPFAGSGTTLMAAKKLGRHFLGFELEKKYCQIAEDRLRTITPRPKSGSKASQFEYFDVLGE